MSEAMFPRSVVERFAIEGFAVGWQQALDAAREAVTGLDSSGVMYEADVLAAIDALKEKP